MLVIVVETHKRRGKSRSDVLNGTLKSLSVKYYEADVASLMIYGGKINQ